MNPYPITSAALGHRQLLGHDDGLRIDARGGRQNAHPYRMPVLAMSRDRLCGVLMDSATEGVDG
jgi:hypothetical protein